MLFSVFSEGGNFSAEEIDNHKRKLERMASLIDTNETNMLKEMEKLEKKHLDEAIKVMLLFQEKFKLFPRNCYCCLIDNNQFLKSFSQYNLKKIQIF